MSDYVIDFRSVVRLVLKLGGLALMIYGLVAFASFAPIFFTRGDSNFAMDAVGFMTAPLITTLFGLFLWLFPSPVSNTLIRKGGAAGQEQQIWTSQLEVIGVGLLGLWLLYRGLSDLVYHLVTYGTRAQSTGLYADGYSEFPAYMVATIAELVVAVFLIFGARGIVRLLRQVRYGGLGIGEEKPES